MVLISFDGPTDDTLFEYVWLFCIDICINILFAVNICRNVCAAICIPLCSCIIGE